MMNFIHDEKVAAAAHFMHACVHALMHQRLTRDDPRVTIGKRANE
jgi:hypothetical protein